MMRQFTIVTIYRFNEFGVDGGPAAKFLRPKLDVFSNHLSAHTGVQVPKQLEVSKLMGFVFMINFRVCDWFNLHTTQVTFRTCHWQIKHLVAAAIVLKGVGGLLFIFGSSLGAFLLVCSRSLSTLFSWSVHGDQHGH